MTQTITKALITMEDLAQGIGSVAQTRGETDYVLGKVGIPYAVTSIASMQALDVNNYTLANVYSVENKTVTEYVYDATDSTGIASTTGAGSWAALSSALVNVTDLNAVCIALGVPYGQAIYSTDTSTLLGTVTYIYVAGTQAAYTIPDEVGEYEQIVDVTGAVLTTGTGEYTMVKVELVEGVKANAASAVVNAEAIALLVAALEATNTTVAENLDKAVAINLVRASQPIVDSPDGLTMPILGTSVSYADGEQLAYDYFVDGLATNITKDYYGNLLLADPLTDIGKVYVDIDLPTNLTLEDLYGSVATGTVDGYTTTKFTSEDEVAGLSLTVPTAGVVRLQIDLAIFTQGAFNFAISEQAGDVTIVSPQVISDTLNALVSDGMTMGGNGILKLSNGFIMQWGYWNTTAGSQNVYFTETFPTACLRVVTGTHFASGTGVNISSGALYPSYFNGSTSNIAVDGTFIAIGN